MIIWQIKQMERNLLDNGVVKVHWKCRIDEINVEEETAYTANRSGTIDFVPDPSSDDFVPYESLTEETVLGWVKAALDVEGIESSLASQIEAQKTPATIAGTPW
jgi:hypothetical protein